jgi:hypothetical protein
VLVEQGVSVTCAVDVRGCSRWWLTKESGRVPACMDAKRCGCNVVAAEGTMDNFRKSYVALQVGDRAFGDLCRVALAELSVTSLDVLVKYVVPLVEVSAQLRVGSAVGVLFNAFAKGLWSRGGLNCMCWAPTGRVCSLCLAGTGAERRFVELCRYSGVYPAGTPSWCFGVTDSVEGVRGTGGLQHKWLVCRAECVARSCRKPWTGVSCGACESANFAL